MSRVLAFILDFEKYKSKQIISWLAKRVDVSEFKSNQKIFSQFIRFFVLEEFFDVSAPEFFDSLGKPYLKNSALFFNLTHTENKIIMVVSYKDIGVDAEAILTKRNFLRIAKRYFGNSEFETLFKSDDLYQDFYTLWTLKEAQIKRSSLGIARGLSKTVFKKNNQNKWVSEDYPNDFFTFFYERLVISICCNQIKQRNFQLFKIVDFKFRKIELSRR